MKCDANKYMLSCVVEGWVLLSYDNSNWFEPNYASDLKNIILSLLKNLFSKKNKSYVLHLMNMQDNLWNIYHENNLYYLWRDFLNNLERDISLSSFKTLKLSPAKALIQKATKIFDTSKDS